MGVTHVYTSLFKLRVKNKGRFTSSFTLKLWNDLTIKSNNLAWNDLSMERSDPYTELLIQTSLSFHSPSRRLNSFL